MYSVFSLKEKDLIVLSAFATNYY